MDFGIKGKVIVVTGGSGVLGGSMAQHFAQVGAKVVLIGRSLNKLDAQVENLQRINPDIIGISCDVMDVDSLRSAKQEILDRYGHIDVLINAAGGNVPGATQKEDQEIFDLDLSEIDYAMDVNLKGSIYPSLIFGEAIAAQGAGSIINISSMATYTAITRVMSYSVAKTGVNSFTQWMAAEMARRFGDKVRVNAIAPGFFIGDQNRKLLLNEDGSLTERSEKVIAKTPMGRFGEITELNGVVQFLCSEAASFVTGVVLPVDGGFSAFSGV
ncbi:D-mannonate oxidoreductase [Reichenbachiella sp. 5M10]|nr:D-mannonate oxidoreductase [Reichenbachiella sp. 5M10]